MAKAIEGPLFLGGPGHVARRLAERLKAARLARNWKRETLAQRAGVSPSSLKRFETSGRVSLQTLLKLCHALGRLDEWEDLLAPPAARSIAELEAQAKEDVRRRRGQL